MKLSIFVCLFLISSGKLQAQDYLLYHQYINLAESHLVNHNSDSTFYYYDKTFKEFDYVFVKDALIAAEFAWKERNKEKTIEYLIKGATNGLRSGSIYECPILERFTNQQIYNEVYDQMKAANNEHRGRINMAMRNDWKERSGQPSIAFNTGETGDFITSVQENVKEIMRLLAQRKFPGERSIGISENDKLVGDQSGFYSLANYDCVITELGDSLWKQVKYGQLHPREFARLWEWQYVKSAHNINLVIGEVAKEWAAQNVVLYGRRNEYVITNRNCDELKQKNKKFGMLVPADKSEEELINKNRKEYYITSLAIDEKKKQLEASEGYRFFFGLK
jgi:hypothetical protein